MRLRVGDLVEVEGRRGEIIERDGDNLIVDAHAGISFTSTRVGRKCRPRDVTLVVRRNRVIFTEFE